FPAALRPAALRPAVLRPAALRPAVFRPAAVRPAALRPAALPPALLPAVVLPAVLLPAVLLPASPPRTTMTEQSFDGRRAVAIHRLAEHVGREVLVQGWLYNMRSTGKLHFLEIRDGSGIVQAVM